MPTRNYGLKWRLMPRFKWRSVPFTGVIPMVQLEIIYNYLVLTIDEVNIQLPSIDY